MRLRVVEEIGCRRLVVGAVEVVARRYRPVDVLMPPPFGSLLTAMWRGRDGAQVVERVRRTAGTAEQMCMVLVNRPGLFVGLFGANIVEVGVGPWGGVLTWVPEDMRRVVPGASLAVVDSLV